MALVDNLRPPQPEEEGTQQLQEERVVPQRAGLHPLVLLEHSPFAVVQEAVNLVLLLTVQREDLRLSLAAQEDRLRLKHLGLVENFVLQAVLQGRTQEALLGLVGSSPSKQQ